MIGEGAHARGGAGRSPQLGSRLLLRRAPPAASVRPMEAGELDRLIGEAMAGNMAAFLQLLEHLRSVREPVHASGVVSASGVASVLRQLRAGTVAPEQAQSWASLVRRGWWAHGTYVIHIDYDESCEDAIADAVGRMDELGDLIDGEISVAETATLLAELERC